MDEIGVQPFRSERDAVGERVVALGMQACSSPYAGSSATGRRAVTASTSPPIQSSPGVVFRLAPPRRHQLHADADAEERPALAVNGLGHRFGPCRRHRRGRAGNRQRLRPRAARSCRPPRRPPGSAVTTIRSSRPSSRDCPLEGLGGGVEIAGPVIDQSDSRRHGLPSRSGKRPITGSGSAPGRCAESAVASACRSTRTGRSPIGEPAREALRLGLGLVGRIDHVGHRSPAPCIGPPSQGRAFEPDQAREEGSRP